MSIQSINHAQLAFPKGQESAIRHFYSNLLELSELGNEPGRALRFVAGAQRLDLVPTDNWEAPSGDAHLDFEVYDLTGLRTRLMNAQLGLDESRPLPGHRRFYVADPAGNVLEFLQPDSSESL
jgi:hypothetical protein